MGKDQPERGAPAAVRDEIASEIQRRLAAAHDSESVFRILLCHCQATPERIALVPLKAANDEGVVCIAYMTSHRDQQAACRILGATAIGTTGVMLSLDSSALSLDRISYWRREGI